MPMNLHIDILTLQLFVTIIEEKSIAKAAEKSNIAASAVSRRISDLEGTLHVELFYRHSKGIDPTPAGFALLEHARIILGNLFQLEMELTGYHHGTRGHIRLFANRSAILETLAHELSAFLVVHPLVRVDLEESISPDTIQAVAENRADLGIFGGILRAPELQVYPYRDDRLVVAVATDHPLATRQSVRFVDLIDYEFVSLEKGSSIDTLCVRAAAELGQQLKVRIRVTGFDAMSRLVEARLGVGIAPLEIMADRMSQGHLVSIPMAEPWAQRSLVLGMRAYASLPQAVRLLVDHLRSGTALRTP
jgi:DNA-binding transcriptional LysR family regulator